MFQIRYSGYHNGPEFPTLAAAKKELKQTIDEETARCRRRMGHAVKVKIDGGYKITIGKDGPLWISGVIYKS